jgi:hypothetical protein
MQSINEFIVTIVVKIIIIVSLTNCKTQDLLLCVEVNATSWLLNPKLLAS